jgi:hypothetical protein
LCGGGSDGDDHADTNPAACDGGANGHSAGDRNAAANRDAGAGYVDGSAYGGPYGDI